MEQIFGNRLNELREERNLTVEALAKRANVYSSLISGIIHNQRHVAERNARQLGLALNLDGTDLEDFIFLALSEAKEKVFHRHLALPPEILNLAGHHLNAAGITPDKIVACKCIRHPQASEYAAEITLNDGRTAVINLTIAYR